MARISRDSYGVPTVHGTSADDVARGQGEACAQDRAWQLEWLRLRAVAGTSAVVGGATAAAWDDLARRFRIVETAQRALAACTPATRRFVAAYVEGVNEGLRATRVAGVPELAHLDHRPGEWEPWTPLATFLAQHVLFGSLGHQLWRRRAHAALGDDARWLTHEGLAASGSNAWAVGGARTRSGLPLIGGDPHRGLEQPGVYQQVRLVCEPAELPGDADEVPFDVVGFSFVGVPGVQHFAHAGGVAWAITNAAADHQDVVEVDPAAPLPADLLELRPGLAVRTTSWVLGELGFDALLPLLRARTADDVEAAFDHWVEPVNNLVVADTAGAVRYRLAGRVPVRDADGAWTGWLEDHHREDVGPHGLVVTANERRGPQSAAVGSAFAPPDRADRIRALLADRSDLTAADLAAVHDDALLPSAAVLRRLVPPDVLDLADFDGVMAADSAPAARFAAWRSALARRVVADPALDALRVPTPEHDHGPLLTGPDDLATRVALALPTLAREALAGRRPIGIDVVAHARAAAVEVAAAVAAGTLPTTWGGTHRASFAHALVGTPAGEGFDAALPTPPVSGDQDAVRTMGSVPGVSDLATRGAVARYVWDLADRGAGGWVVPTGASALPGAHRLDQLDAWVAGLLLPCGAPPG